jgi:hypothetical protein
MALPELLMPVGLPDFKADEHVATPQPLYATVERQGGSSRRRRLFRSAPWGLDTALEVTQQQLETFYAWHETPLQAGAQPFTAKVAKIGAGAQYWKAWCREFTAEHQEGSTHLIRLKLRLEGDPQDTPPTLSTLSAEVASALDFSIEGGYPWALYAEATGVLEFTGITGAGLEAEAFGRLYTTFNGGLSGVPLDAEVEVGLDHYAIILPSEAFDAEASAGLVVLVVTDMAITAEVSVPLSFTDATGLGYDPAPTSFAVSATRAGSSTLAAKATIEVRPDGQIFKRVNTGGYILHDNWWNPTQPNVGDLLWVRCVVVSGTAPQTIAPVTTGMLLNVTRTWTLSDTSPGALTNSLRIDIAIDPDFLSVVSSFTGTLDAEWTA